MFWESVLIAIIAIAVHKLVLFVVGSIRKDNSIVDVFYGLAFIIATSAVAFMLGVENIAGCIVLILIALWGVRLSYRIIKRHRGEDPRYRKWREEWMAKGRLYFYIRSFLQVYVLQGGIILIILLPTLGLISQTRVPLFYVLVFGVFLWLVGFLFEVITDAQLDRYIKKPDPKPAIFTEGLYNYSRHPNYFGEATCWWAIWFITVAAVPSLWWTIISPLTITYVLVAISAPMLERSFEGREGWETYRNTISYFLPLPPRK